MTYQSQTSGPQNPLEYMASGLPYFTQSLTPGGSATLLQFPFVSNFVTVKNDGGGDLYIGATQNGVLGANRFTVSAGDTITLDIRVKDFFLADGGSPVSYSLAAGMTGIIRKDFWTLTGSFNVFKPVSGSTQTADQFHSNVLGYDGLG